MSHKVQSVNLLEEKAFYVGYAPEVGRWNRRDPAEDEANINLYLIVANGTIYKIDVLGGWEFSEEWEDIVDRVGNSIDEAKKLYRTVKLVTDKIIQAGCSVIKPVMGLDVMGCVCGLASLGDNFFNKITGAVIEYTDCGCNLGYTLYEACTNGAFTRKTILQGVLTAIDCFSIETSVYLGTLIGTVIEPAGGSIMGSIIGATPAAEGLTDTAVWMVQNMNSQDNFNPIPWNSICNCWRVGGEVKEKVEEVFGECPCKRSIPYRMLKYGGDDLHRM